MKTNFSNFQSKKYPKSLFVVFQITERCNLNCRYCYILRDSNATMPLSIAYRAVDFFTALYRRNIYDSITICFHGGEPVVIFNDVKRIVKYARDKGINKFVIGTNGIGLEPRKINFMISNNITPYS